jgi:hypothetical protein
MREGIDNGLSRIIVEVTEQIHQLGMVSDESFATLLACWAAGTHARAIFPGYGYVFIRSVAASCEKARTLLHLLGRLAWEPRVSMVARRSRRLSWRRQMKGRPVIFTGLADLPARLAERAFHIVMGPDYSREPYMMQGGIAGLELDNRRHRLETCVYASRRQIKSLYRRLPSEVEVLREFEPSFQEARHDARIVRPPPRSEYVTRLAIF